MIFFQIFSATTTVPYSSAPTTPSTKFESIKSWTISTYKCSRQTIYEKLGKSSRTVDSELEAQIESLRETQRKYANILRLSRALTSHFYHVIQTQVNVFHVWNKHISDIISSIYPSFHLSFTHVNLSGCPWWMLQWSSSQIAWVARRISL